MFEKVDQKFFFDDKNKIEIEIKSFLKFHVDFDHN